MRKPLHSIDIFKARRQKLSSEIEGSALIIAAHPHFVRNNDVHHPYRPDTNMFYLTGFEEPNAVFVFRPGLKPETVMFVQPKDQAKEIWDGFRFGPEGVKTIFGMDQAFTINQLETELPKLIDEVDKIYYSMFINREIDQKVLAAVESQAAAKSRSNKGHLAIEDPRALLGELRIRKDAFEIGQMRRAGEISAKAHIEVMRACRPGVSERALQGVFIRSIMEQGAMREGYGSIVAGGGNATVLHYVFNDQQLQSGDFLLIDAGAEYQYYTGDITRTYPVNGKFSPAQKRIYSKVLEVQKNLVAAVRPGETRESLQKKTIDGLVDIMLDENLLQGKKSEIIEQKKYLKYYMHGVSHWLGMDVHDAGVIAMNGEPRRFEPGFCLTIEPGLYIPPDDNEAPTELRGIGIRIEDDILVTADGHENLTALCPKDVDALESIIGR
jgi:Xaa-Pro aminopeptidase